MYMARGGLIKHVKRENAKQNTTKIQNEIQLKYKMKYRENTK